MSRERLRPGRTPGRAPDHRDPRGDGALAPGRRTLAETLAGESAENAPLPRPQPLPANLAVGIRELASIDLDGVRVYYDSPLPAAIGAEAFARGLDIHLAPGAEAHLPHEAWHIVQQQQGRVVAGEERGGVAMNTDAALEREADELGAQAIVPSAPVAATVERAAVAAGPPVLQGKLVRQAAAPRSEEAEEEVDEEEEEELVGRSASGAGSGAGEPATWVDDADGAVYVELATNPNVALLRGPDGRHVLLALESGELIRDRDMVEAAATSFGEDLHARGATLFLRDPVLDADDLAYKVADADAEARSDAQYKEAKQKHRAEQETKKKGGKKRRRRKKEVSWRPAKKKQKIKKIKLPVEFTPSSRGARLDIDEPNKVSPFTASVALRPIAPGVVSGGRRRYAAHELTVDAVAVSNMDRGPTKFGDDQMSHTVAWTLLRRGLAGLAGRPYLELHEFLSRGAQELRHEKEKEGARTYAKSILGETDEALLGAFVAPRSERVAEGMEGTGQGEDASARDPAVDAVVDPAVDPGEPPPIPAAPAPAPAAAEDADVAPMEEEDPGAAASADAPADGEMQAPLAPMEDIDEPNLALDEPALDEDPLLAPLDEDPLLAPLDEDPLLAPLDEDPLLAPLDEDPLLSLLPETGGPSGGDASSVPADPPPESAAEPEYLAHIQSQLAAFAPPEPASPEPVAPAPSTPDPRFPLEVWIGLASRLARNYVVAYQRSDAATYNKKAKGRAEATHARVLTAAEHGEGVSAEEVADAAIGLIDVNFTLPPRIYRRAVYHWYELLGLAFPRVMAEHGAAVWARACEANATEKWLEKKGAASLAEVLGEAPEHAQVPPNKTPAGEVGRYTGLTAHVLVAPMDDAPRSEDSDREEMYTLADLEVAELGLGEERPPTRFRGKQRSHTVAWTLVRASILAFSGRPLVDLHDYLQHAVAHFAADLDDLPDAAVVNTLGGGSAAEQEAEEAELAEEAEVAPSAKDAAPADAAPADAAPADAVPADAAPALGGPAEPPPIPIELTAEEREAAIAADLEQSEMTDEGAWTRLQSAQRLTETVQGLASCRMPLSAWYRLLSDLVVELMRVYQLTRSATYSTGEEKPAGHAEGDHMAKLRRNEQQLIEHGYTLDAEDVIITSALKLLDVAFGNPTLPWQSYARAVIHWVECLRNAFPTLMRAGGADITAPILRLPLDAKGWEVPKGAKTVADLVRTELEERRTHAPARGRAVTIPEGAEDGELLAGRSLVARPVAGLGDGGLRAFAVGLMGAVGQGSLPADGVAAVLARVGISAARVEALAGLVATPAGARAVEAALFPALRRLAVDALRATPELQQALAAELSAEIAHRFPLGPDEAGPAAPPPSRFTGTTLGAALDGIARRIAARDVTPEERADEAAAWARDAGVRLYIEQLDAGGRSVGQVELDALAALFGVQLARIFEHGEGGEAQRVELGPAPEGEALPVLGLAQRGGRWSTLTNEDGGYDLAGARELVPAPPGFSMWEATTPLQAPQELEAEGSFLAGGERRIVWETSGNNNCAFNAFALVLVGLVSQGRIQLPDAAARLQLDEDLLGSLSASAPDPRRDPAQARLIQHELSRPLRAAAVRSLWSRGELKDAMFRELREHVGGRVRASLGVAYQEPASDLFLLGSPLEAHLLGVAAEIAGGLRNEPTWEQANAEARVLQIDRRLEETTQILRAWFDATGLEIYLAHVAKDGVWGGASELHALAAELGVDIVTFSDTGESVYGDAGRGIEAAEGEGAEHAPRPEIGMFRHRHRAHWSAVSTEQGAYDLQDGTDRLAGTPAPLHRVDEATLPRGSSHEEAPSYLAEALAQTFEPGPAVSSSGPVQVVDVGFQRVPKLVGTTQLDYADHKFGRSKLAESPGAPFSVSAVDPGSKLSPGDNVALVNAANSTMVGTAGIALAIQEAANKQWPASKYAGGQLDEGDAKRTDSHELAKSGVQHIIHTVGPYTSDPNWQPKLESCCTRILEEADAANVDCIVFCLISGAIFNKAKLPLGTIAKVIVDAVEKALATKVWTHPPKLVVFNNFPGKQALAVKQATESSGEKGETTKMDVEGKGKEKELEWKKHREKEGEGQDEDEEGDEEEDEQEEELL